MEYMFGANGEMFPPPINSRAPIVGTKSFTVLLVFKVPDYSNRSSYAIGFSFGKGSGTNARIPAGKTSFRGSRTYVGVRFF